MMWMITRPAAALSLLAVVFLAAAPLQAQTWPTRTVKFILPLGPGAGADISARLFADKLSARWGQPVVVENRPGGDGMVAITGFQGARDDHTLLFSPTSSFTAHPYLHDKLPYDPNELVPVARISNTLVTISTGEASKIGSLKELFARARAQPGQLNWATVTGMTDLIIAGYLKQTGIEMAKIPYRDTVQALNDTAEGRLHLYWAAYAIVRPQVQAGRVKILAMTNSGRAAAAPDIATVQEMGFPQLTFDGLVGLFSTRDMPAEIRERIAADVRTVAADPAIQSRLTATGQVVNPGTSTQFAAAIEVQRAQVAAVAKTLGIAPKQ
jgi:tripartite-type tricarboxylate transporter receptor subunit TctC